MNRILTYRKARLSLRFVLLLSLLLMATKSFSQITNPAIPVSDLISECPDTGYQMPKIFLCGASSNRQIPITSSNVASVIWEKLDETSCPVVINRDCTNTSTACSWTQKGTGATFTVSEAGQYRVTITDSSGVPTIFYFNVYQNGLNIPITKTDIYCGNPGKIIAAQLTGYEYSLDGTTYQNSNTFSIVTAGDYTVKVRRIGATSDCVFEIPVTIENKALTVTPVVTQSLTSGQQGDIKLIASGVREQYFYKITGASLINEVGPILANEYTFPNLNAGTYTWSVKTTDCNWKSGDVTINSVAPFQITPTVQPVTCQPGSIQVVVDGGTPPYQYYFNGKTTPETSEIIPVTLAGTYTVKVVDNNGLTDQITVTVPVQSAPAYTIEKSNLNCYYPNTWQIKFNVSNEYGNSLKYSIDNGVTFSDNPIFQGLSATPAGTTFKTIIEYTYGGVKCTKTEDVTLFQPPYGLSATAGVSELIGCLPSPHEDKAKIRITNPQGGTPPYQYSFDNQKSWTTDNFSLLPAGQHEFFIKDDIGCISALAKVTVENIGVPNITVSNDTFNCDGTANSTVNITSSTATNFSYTYTLDGALPQTTPNFSNIEPGQHSVEVKYEPLIVPTYSNLLKEDFGYGADTTSPGMSSAYCFERQVSPVTCNISKGWGLNINDGEYAVTSYIVYPFGAWYRPKDHTNQLIAKGRYLVVNIQGDNTRPIIYEKEIKDIIPNQLINVEFFATNLLRIGNTQYNPNLRVALVNASGVEIDFYNTGLIPKTENWQKYSTQLNPGNNTTLRFQIRSIEQNGSGNDLAIDDITAYQIPKLCAATKIIPFTVPTGKAFEASITNTKNATCSGASNGEITIAAQNFNINTGYQYSKDGGATWQTATTSPFKITSLVAGDYSIKVRYNTTATGVCVKSFLPITITVPTPLVTTATVLPLATCSRGATITANSNGGTPFYQYELWDELNTTKIRLAQNSGVFEDVPVGTYTVRGLDANGCGNTTPVSITVVPPPIPIPSLDSTLDLCYDAVNQAKIKINVSSGTAPFSYSLDGGALQNSNTFLNVGPGIHTVEVTDANNCKANTQDIKIGDELKVAAVLTKGLDCTASPDAIIKVTISGGARAIRYRIFKNGIKITPNDIAVLDTVTSFIYVVNEAQHGDYAFEIIDANGCLKTTNLVTINPKMVPVINSITQTQSILCHGDKTAAIQVNLDFTKGLGPFSYDVKDVTSLPHIGFGNQVSGLPAGTYEVTVTDSNLCTAKLNKTISEPLKLVVQSHAVPITCDRNNGQSKGSVVVDGVSGGVALYNYFVTGVNGYNENEKNTEGDTSYKFDVVDFGLYQINVVDNIGCSVLIQDVLVASPPTDLNIGVTNTSISCLSGGTAEVQVVPKPTIIGPFHFAIYTGPGMTYSSGSIWKDESLPGSLKTTFTGLIPGVKYTFIVYDETTKCYHYKTAEAAIPTNSTLEVSSLTYKNIRCKGSADGKVSFTIKNNYAVTTPIFYQVYNSQSLVPVNLAFGTVTLSANSSTTISDLGDLPFGNYFVLIKEDVGATNAGCSIATNTFNITESAIDLSLLPKVIKNANCNEKGTINLLAKDGTAPYQYQIVTDGSSVGPGTSISPVPPPPSLIPGNWVNQNTFNVDGGNYIVSVKDAYGCVKSMTIYLPKDPEPVIALSVPNLCVPEGTFTINITTTAGIQPYYLSVNGSVFTPATLPYALSNQNSGDYSISVKDVNGCSDTKLLKIYSPLGLSSTVIKQPTCATNDGEIQASAQGGSGSFEYKIDSGIYSSVFNFTGLSSGNHTITIKDTSTGCEKSILVTLEDPTPITGLTLSQKPVTCNGGNDGSISATIDIPAAGTNDNPVYTYSLNRGTPQASNIFSGLATGSYTVKVISGRGCVETAPVFVNEPSVIVVPTPSVTQFGCNSTNNLNNASITVSGVTGGSGIYTQYEFIKNGSRVQFGPNPTYIETDLNGGSYIIKVYDDKGCSGSTVATIQPFYILDTITVNTPNPISCASSETIQVSVSGIGGTPTNLEYSLSTISGSMVGTTIPSNSSGIFSGLTVGEYLITAKNTVTLCSIQEVYTVNEPNTFDLTIDSVVDATCFGGTNGSANITLIDRNLPSKAGAFSYTIKDSSGNLILTSTVTNAGPISIPGLKADTYSITATLTTTPFCSITKNFTISQPTSALVLSESHSDITCVVGNIDGKITALPTGGWSNFYEFKWEKAGTVIEDWGDVYELTNLTQGIYKLYTRDARGCVTDKQVELKNPTPIVLTAAADKTLLQCFADRLATISITSVSGGQGSNYWFSLKTIGASPSVLGPQASNEFKNLGAGTYTVTLTDNWSCTATSSPISINEPNNVVATLSLLTPPTCMNPAQLDLQITGGTSPYSFSADNSIFNLFSATSVPLNGNAGVNHYYVKDSNGCGSYVSNDVVVESPKGLSVTIDTTFAKVNCYGESTAAIVAKAQGGLGSYSYTLLDELDNPLRPSQSSSTFSSLPAGKYKVEVTSADCVPADSGIITIQQPAAKLIPAYSLTNALCAGSNDGTITVVSTGGTVVIKQAISPNLSQFTESDLFENLAAGTYDVVVQDALGCYEKTTQVITQPNPIIASNIAASIVQEICFDDKNAAFSIDVSGGTKPYNVSLDNPSGPFTTGTAFQTQFDFTGLTGGSHTVYVQDANNCTFDWTVNLDESVKLDPTTTVDYRCVSNAQHNLVTVNLDSSITDFSLVQFSLDGGIYQPTNIFSNLTPGDHFIRVKHKNGCIKDTPVFNILKIDPLILSLKEGGLNEIIAVAADGGGNYKYTFDGEFTGSSPSYIYYKTQPYLVTVQDANGCTASVTQLFNYIDICTPNYFTPNGDGISDTWAPGCTINYKDLTFTVLDRYGREINTYKLGQSWDGKYQGVELPSGDYWYVLKLNNSKDDREFVGHFTLYR